MIAPISYFLFALLLSCHTKAVIARGQILIGNNNIIDDVLSGLDITISACSSDAIIISSRSSSSPNVNVSSILKPGYILAQIGADDYSSIESKDDIMCSNECYPLLRKIVSYDAVDNKFMTTFATFSDIFPKEMYDPSLSDAHVEPLFECSHSSDDTITSADLTTGDEIQQKNQGRRRLQTAAPSTSPSKAPSKAPSRTPSIAPSRNPSTSMFPSYGPYIPPTPGTAETFCYNGAGIFLVPLFLTCLICPIVCFFPPAWLFCFAILFVIGGSLQLCFSIFDILGIGRILGIDGASTRRQLEYFPNATMDDILSLFGKRNLDKNADILDKNFEITTPPLVCEEWTQQRVTSSSADASCNYVDCNIGDEADPINCYHCKANNVNVFGKSSTNFDSLCSIRDYDFYGMINVVHVIERMSISSNNDPNVLGFHDAFCVQDHCYSSNVFDKTTCDQSFYQALQNTCISSVVVNTAEIQQTVQFPLKTSTIEKNCHMLSLLIYLGTKKFGRGVYQKRQRNQIKHNKNHICQQKQDTTSVFSELQF